MNTAKIDKLVRMANQIGDFFAPMPEEVAIKGVALHLKRFWTPKMIGELVADIDSGHKGLNTLAARAVEALKAENASSAKAEVATNDVPTELGR